MPQKTPNRSPVKYCKSPNRQTRIRAYKAEEINQHKARFDKSLDDRSYPRRDVVHFESPPRRRLRETEDDAIKVYHESKCIQNLD